MLVSVIAVLSMLPLVLADGWDDFSNNLATDLAPFLSLFGEQITKQYLSESITMMDYFIFAMAPMGILTAVVSAIRVCGSPSLRAFIGRAQEGGGDAEAELCSSTSRDVCELYNNGGIARVFGRPKILEIVYDPAEEPFDEKIAGIYMFQGYLQNKSKQEGQHNWYRKTPEAKKSECESGFKSEIPRTTFAPNLSLNIGIKKQPPIVFWLIGLGGLVLQTGVLAFAIIVTYYLKWDKEDGLPEAYACPLFFIGTLLVCGGMFLCAFLVGQSTDEEVWCRKEEQSDRLSFFWMQPGGQIIGDQTFDAFCHSDSDSPGDGLMEYTTSWKEVKSREIKHSDRGSDESKEPRPANQISWKNRLRSSEMQVWAAVGVTISGFVLQFTGLRALHSAISVAQLGITMVMSAARAGLRMRRLNPGANAFASFPDQILGHELDWLALRIGQQSVPKCAGSSDNGQKYFWKFCGTSDLTSTIIREEPSHSQDPSSGTKLLAYRTRLAQLTESLEAMPKSTWGAQNFDIVMVEVRREAQRLAMAIEGAINVIFSQGARVHKDWRSAEKMRWRFQCTVSSLNPPTIEGPQDLYLHFVRGRGGNWELEEKQRLEGLLGLWTWSLKSDPAAETLDLQGQFKVSKATEIRAERIAATEWTAESRDLKEWLKKEEIQLPDEPISLEPSFIGDPNIIWHEDDGISKPASNRPYNEANHRLYGWHGTDLQPVSTTNTTTGFKVWPVPTNNTLLSLCAQEVFGSFFTSSLAILHDVGTIDSEGTDEVALVEKDLISQMMELFTKTKFGSRSDALLCVLPSIIGPVHRTPLSLAAMHGKEALVQHELQLNPARPYAHDKDRDERTALWWAIRNQREAAVSVLLAENPVEDTVVSQGRTLLSIAAEIGHEGVLKLLLGTGKFKADAMDEDEETPLSWAAKKGLETPLRLLLGYKVTKTVLSNTDDRTALSWAAEDGNYDVVKSLLERDRANAYARDQGDGRTPLSWAAEKGRERVVRLLLDNSRVNPDAKDDNDGRTPLSRAAENGHRDIVKLLLDNSRVSPDAKDQKEGRTPLSWAAGNGHKDIVQQLLSVNGVAPDAKDEKEGRTPLSWAAGNGHEDVVRLLLQTDHKVDPETRDSNGRTPASWAAGNGHEESFEELLTDTNVNLDAKDEDGCTPFCWAAKNGQDLFVHHILSTWEVSIDEADEYGRTPLSFAAENGHEWIVEQLLETGKVCPDAKDTYERTPLSWAATNGHEEIVQQLLETKKVSTDTRDIYKCTPLSLAAREGHAAVVRLLLKSKYDVKETDEHGRTPFSWAAGNGHDAVVEAFLLQHDIDPDTKDLYGRTPLSWAAENGHEGVVGILLRDSGVKPYSRDNYDRMPLSWAIRNGHELVVQLLLGDKRFEDVQDKYGRTILLWAIQNGPTSVMEVLLGDPRVKVDTKDQHGQTPLSWAARIGDEKTVKLLLGSDEVEPDSKDERGMTPLMWAAKEAAKKRVLEWTHDKYSTADIASMDPERQKFYKALMDHEEEMNPKFMAAFDEDERRKLRSVELARKERALASGEVQNKPDGARLSAKTPDHEQKLSEMATDAPMAAVEEHQHRRPKTPDDEPLLSVTIRDGHTAVIELLLHQKINPNAKNMDGHTALCLVGKSKQNEVIELLVGKGAIKCEKCP